MLIFVYILLLFYILFISLCIIFCYSFISNALRTNTVSFFFDNPSFCMTVKALLITKCSLCLCHFVCVKKIVCFEYYFVSGSSGRFAGSLTGPCVGIEIKTEIYGTNWSCFSKNSFKFFEWYIP